MRLCVILLILFFMNALMPVLGTSRAAGVFSTKNIANHNTLGADEDHNVPMMQRTAGTVPVEIWVPDNYTRIGWAIGNASDGDTIRVRAGTYHERLAIGKPMQLIGEQPVSTIIDGESQGNVITVSANNVVIQNFTIKNSMHAIYGRLCAGICIDNSGSLVYNNALLGNIITGNGGDGIAFYYTSNNTISGNSITNNVERSIFLYDSSNNSINGNTIADNNIGISIQESFNNNISENTIKNNGYGIYFSYSSGYNKFYHNNFMNNTRQVEFHPQAGCANLCDDEYPSGGNYWSDYIGTDVNHDGFGDTPYVIDANNTDHYPLITQYIIPEFPSFLVLPLLMTSTLLMVSICKRKPKTACS